MNKPFAHSAGAICMGIVVLVLMTLLTTGVAAAQSGVLAACVNRGNGMMRLVASSSACHKNEKFVQWNITGPRGPAGPQGPPGLTTAGLSGVQEFTASSTFTVPAGITHLLVDVWGGGGSAGVQGGGGGSGAYSRAVIPVVPGVTYSIVVGAAGTVDSAGNGQNGGDSRIVAPDGTVLLFAGGGHGGTGSAAGCIGGTGGAADPSAPIHREGFTGVTPTGPFGACPIVIFILGGGPVTGVINPPPVPAVPFLQLVDGRGGQGIPSSQPGPGPAAGGYVHIAW